MTQVQVGQVWQDWDTRNRSHKVGRKIRILLGELRIRHRGKHANGTQDGCVAAEVQAELDGVPFRGRARAHAGGTPQDRLTIIYVYDILIVRR